MSKIKKKRLFRDEITQGAHESIVTIIYIEKNVNGSPC